MIGLTAEQLELLTAILQDDANGCVCSPACLGMPVWPPGVRGVADALAEQGRLRIEPCAYTKKRHGYITDVGREALRVHAFVRGLL